MVFYQNDCFCSTVEEINHMLSTITKRIATAADTEFARRAHHAAYHDVVVRQFGVFDEQVQDTFFTKSWKPEVYQILLDGEMRIGYCSVEDFLDHIRVHELVLLPEFQRQGIGSGILQEILAEAKAKNVPVSLEVLKESSAQYFYHKLGFKNIGSTETHVQMKYSF